MRIRVFVLGLFYLLLVGCAGLRPNLEQPVVSLTSFRMLPSQSMTPTFEIGLQVVNPNRTELNLEGVSYSVFLEGHRLLTGVSNQLPVIAGYGSADIRLVASPDLLGGMRLIGDLMAQQRERFGYHIEAKLDLGALVPSVRIREEGEISLTPSPR